LIILVALFEKLDAVRPLTIPFNASRVRYDLATLVAAEGDK
jgi:hypothetical protein